MQTIKTLQFKDKEDQELLGLINTYTRLVRGVVARAAIRSLLLRVLPQEIKRLGESNGSLTAS